MAEINITPMVDVMLVLLIIFMVTAPLLVTGVPVDLPDSKAKALKADDTPIQVSIDAKGTGVHRPADGARRQPARQAGGAARGALGRRR